MRERKYVWYVEPLDSDTNSAISDYLKESSITAECKSVLCADGKKRNLWRCNSFDLVQALRNSKKSLNLRFKVYIKEGRGSVRSGPPFLSKKKGG